ncbi:MAG TPA: NAD(P)-dependent oxidoreductase, partial [Nitrospirales bacterium]|nr:NAD(P)-dependent oxidoreductase [Nitrospirales bacterium]
WRALPLEEVLAVSDFVSVHVPLTPDTEHLIGKRELERMKPGAYLLNTARGPVVNEGALVEALRSGWIAGAGLDVYEREPALHDGLFGCPNVVTLPHLGSATLATRVAMGLAVVENLVAVLIDGKEPPNRVA